MSSSSYTSLFPILCGVDTDYLGSMWGRCGQCGVDVGSMCGWARDGVNHEQVAILVVASLSPNSSLSHKHVNTPWNLTIVLEELGHLDG